MAYNSKKPTCKCITCKGWINPVWTRGDGDYRHCECKVPRPEKEELKAGDKVMVTVEATVKKVSNGHGLCYEVELPLRDFSSPRRVWVDEEETIQI